MDEIDLWGKFMEGYVLTNGSITIHMTFNSLESQYWYYDGRRRYLYESTVLEYTNDDEWEWKFNCKYTTDEVRKRISAGDVLRKWDKRIEGRDVETENGGLVKPILREEDTWSYITWEEVARYASTYYWKWA